MAEVVLRRVLPNEVSANTVESVEAVTRAQSQEIVDDVRTNGLEGFVRQSLRLRDLKSGRCGSI